MRTLLDTTYRLSGAVAALFLCAIVVIVLLQVGANMIDSLMRVLTGEPIGLTVSSYSEFTGFFLVAASFFGLAYTLRGGAHIRVTLLVRLIKGPARLWVESWCTGVAALLSAYFTWHTALMVFDSYSFNDMSAGMIAVPIWVPQSSMVLGLFVFSIALIDEFIRVICGNEPTYMENKDGQLGRDQAEIDTNPMSKIME